MIHVSQKTYTHETAGENLQKKHFPEVTTSPSREINGNRSTGKEMQGNNLSLMPLGSIIELLTDKFQVTSDIEQIFGIRMKLMEYALLTYPQFQIYGVHQISEEMPRLHKRRGKHMEGTKKQ